MDARAEILNRLHQVGDRHAADFAKALSDMADPRQNAADAFRRAEIAKAAMSAADECVTAFLACDMTPRGKAVA